MDISRCNEHNRERLGAMKEKKEKLKAQRTRKLRKDKHRLVKK